MNESTLALIDKLQNSRKNLSKKIDDLHKTLLIECKKCKSKYEIGNITYIQLKYYVQPYSCTGGDYWTDDEGNWICEKCGFTNRLISELDKFYNDLKYSFKERIDRYPKRGY